MIGENGLRLTEPQILIISDPNAEKENRLRNKIIALSVLLLAAIWTSGCGKKDATQPLAGDAAAAAKPAEAETAAPSKGGFEKIGDFLDAWSAAFKQNEEAINAYEGMPILELVTAPATFIGTSQYDLLNLENKNGRFEGTMMLSGIKGFVEKSGSKIAFGYDRTLDKDGFGPLAKTGDHEVEKGSADLDRRHYLDESTTERGGKVIVRTVNEFKQLSDGSIICLVFRGQAINARGEEEAGDSVIYIHNGKGRYDFVVGKGTTGPGFAGFSFAEKGDLTKDQAIEALKAAGYTLEKSGGIADGKIAVDK